MKHRRKQRILGRTAKERRALWRTLSSSLFEHESIVTTRARALELRRHVEPLVTKAKGELTLHRRRQLLRELGAKADLDRLLSLAARYADRPGGYLRVIRMPQQRHDQAEMAQVSFIADESAGADTEEK